MTTAELIEHTRVPNTNSVFFLGCFDNRVTLYSQQVRALNLVDAILDRQLVRKHGKVAIVGGGAGGITAAAAFAKAAPELRKIDLFEARGDILEFQRHSSRFLHPHNYDWPAAGADRIDAGLPILNWRAGSADDVASWLRRQFEDIALGSPISVYVDAKVTGVTPFEHSQARVLLDGANRLSDTYDVVILSIGFGLESHLSGETASYWTPSPLAAPILVGGEEPTIFVSGNGDGGLVDFMIAAMNGSTHKEVCDLIVGLPFGPALAELSAIEQQAWQPGAAVDLFEAYRTRVLPQLPPAVLAEVGDNLRAGVKVWLHTAEPQLFKRTTALLNRIGVFLIIAADQNFARNAITIKVGEPFVGGVPTTGPVRFAGEADLVPWRRLLRLGPDSGANLSPFQLLVDRLPEALRRPDRSFRSASPRLTVSASLRFAPFHSPAEAPAPAALANNAQQALTGVLRIDRANGGQLGVSGNLVPGALAAVWSARRAITIDCNVPAHELGHLASALARLCAHSRRCVFYCEDRRRWNDVMHAFVMGRAMPGPHLEVGFDVEEARELHPAIDPIFLLPNDFAEAIHAELDAAVVDELHGILYDSLRSAVPVEMGWVLDPHLRVQLWDHWLVWHAMIQADPVTCRRFLLLLVSERDPQMPETSMLVRVGPKALRPFLLKAVLFGLAFSVGSRRNLSPTQAHPGNLHSDGLSGHACGVSWIDGRELNAAIADRPWTTAVVLLAELKSAFRLLQGEPRLDQAKDGPPLIGEPANAERSLVLGADDVFQAAMEAGEQALIDYLSDVLNWRASAAANSLERA